MSIRRWVWVVLSAAGILVATAFQNCSKASMSSPEMTEQSKLDLANCQTPECRAIQNGDASCSFNGAEVRHGEAVISYENSTVVFGQTCQSQTRICDNGVLSGSFQFPSCTVGSAAACLFNGKMVAHGEKVDAYLKSTEPFGGTCVKESRTCANGQLSGSYQFATCKVDEPAACLFNGKTVASGTSVVAYREAKVAFGGTCLKEVRSCLDGKLGGNYAYESCVVTAPMWVNVISKKETHAQACARVGGLVPTDKTGLNGQGICASPESQPMANGGDGALDIKFPYGVGKYSGNKRAGGQLIVREDDDEIYCYKPGQKQDDDHTDLLVAYLCVRK